MAKSRDVILNEAFRPQRVTGQQRYATEIADQLLAKDGFTGIRPPEEAGAIRAWLWTLLVLPWRSRGHILVSFTARSPLWKRRHILVVHDLFVLTNPEWYSRRYIWTHAPLLKLQLATAAALVAVSEPVAQELRRRQPGKLIEIAPNAPSTVFSHPGGEDEGVLDRLGISPGSYLLVVGSQDPRKNLARLAEAYASLPIEARLKTPLVLVGASDKIFRGESIDWPAETIMAGYVTDAELQELYSGSAAVALVSLAEGFGLPIVEAIAAGAGRLLLSDLSVFRWICGESAIYVDPTSVEAIAEGIARVVAEDAPATDNVDLSRFDWKQSAAVIQLVSEKLARGSQERGPQ